jgi:hypothetical protein
MRLANNLLHAYLSSLGMRFIYHSNTVATSCSFALFGGLLSRHCCEQRGLPLSFQYTDAIDKAYGIWNDIFFDSVDIHQRISDRNKYGPILFIYSIDILLDSKLSVWITKSNPSKWGVVAPDARYFSNLQEVQSIYNVGTFDYILTLRDHEGPLYFDPYLRSVLVDDCAASSGRKSYEEIKDLLLYYSARGGIFSLNNKIEKRNCCWCKCEKSYLDLLPHEIARNFSI